ncbi:transducin family protein / WD-40 repeat family protein [Striga hermonthica]|uniref:Transducin family protein / WD-40 repeat family protein n=1 Tax=Striga hermonthica TaxID=68872 RepID=A0A9N7NLR5_STRHE|nr:transducin family protein / WD-40 repeat family protein [Striga hermonthica]
MITKDNSPSTKETSTMDTSKYVFSKYYEYLPYMRLEKESILNVLHSRETGTDTKIRNKSKSNPKWSSFTRKSQCFYTRSLCAAKIGRPLFYSITNVEKGVDKRLRPRQFEYHPSDSGLMAIGTLDGEVIVVNHETGNIVSRVSSCGDMNSILGLCWLKGQPSKLLVGSDNGSLRLYDVNYDALKSKDCYRDPAVTFDDFEQLTSVHVNSTDDRCLTSGYSKKVAIYDICSGKRLHLLSDMHREPINVAKFSNHSPSLFVTSSFDRDVKMWDTRRKPVGPCFSARSTRGNVMVVFSPDDLYLLVSAVDNEVKQLLSVDGRLHTDFGIVSTGSAHNYTRSYYMNGRDYIISGSCEESTVRVCCAQTGRRLNDISLEDMRWQSSIFVQSLRSDPFRHFNMAILAAYARPISKYEIVKVDLLSSSHSNEENCEGLKGG